jgi:hypothetical protein
LGAALCALCVALTVSAGLAASRDGASRQKGLRLARESFAKSYPTGMIGLELDREAQRRFGVEGRVIIEEFPLPGGRTVDLDVRPFDILTPDARIVVVDVAGSREAPRPKFRAFRGTVVGDPDSRVTLGVFDGRIAGSIALWDEEFVIAPREFDLAKPGSGELRAWSRKQFDEEPRGPGCEGHAPEPRRGVHLQGPRSTAGALVAGGIDENTLLQADIAIDATFEWYDHFGSLTAAQDYILNLMAQVSTIYENEVKVQVQVSYLRVFTTTTDPYTDGSTNTSVLLDDLRNEWNTNQTGISRTAAHLFSVRGSGGAGLAYVDVLCNHDFQPGSSYDYGVSTLSAGGGSWEKDLVAHELGHNFSSPHTHCFVPEIDQCANQSGCYQGSIVPSVGTIMSYCDDSVSVFHARVRDEQIRPAAEGAFPTCITTAGLPGGLEGNDAVVLAKPQQCPGASFDNDDGGVNSFTGYIGSAQMAWVKRFTPSCYPFRLERVDVMIGESSSVAPGRGLRVLVYTDPAGTGDPANATLAHAEDSVVQVVSTGTFNQYTLGAPVTLTSGDYYVGFYDLVADAPDTYIASIDTGASGDAYRTANSTSPEDYQAYGNGTWLIRAAGGPVGPGALMLQWGAPCNDATTPSQDFAVYGGSIGDFADYSSLTCTTGRASSFMATDAATDSFYLVVPATSANEGSYGRSSDGVERPAAAAACKLQSFESCP